MSFPCALFLSDFSQLLKVMHDGTDMRVLGPLRDLETGILPSGVGPVYKLMLVPL